MKLSSGTALTSSKVLLLLNCCQIHAESLITFEVCSWGTGSYLLFGHKLVL